MPEQKPAQQSRLKIVDPQALADADRWADAMHRVADAERRDRRRGNEIIASLDVIWCDWEQRLNTSFRRPVNWTSSVRGMINAGANLEDLEYAFDVSLGAPAFPDIWRYFCGVMWTTIKQRRTAALLLVQNMDES